MFFLSWSDYIDAYKEYKKIQKEEDADDDFVSMLKENVSMCKEQYDFFKKSVEEATTEYNKAKFEHDSMSWDDDVEVTCVVPGKGRPSHKQKKSKRDNNTIEKLSAGFTPAKSGHEAIGNMVDQMKENPLEEEI